MALSAAATFRMDQNSAQGTFEVKNTVVIYPGALVSFDGTSGRVKPYDGTIGDRLAGWSLGVPPVVGSAVITGNTSASPPPRVALHFGGGRLLENCPVTGASAETDQGKPVYATDDGTYTLTDPTTHRVVAGYVTHYRASGYADVATVFILGTLGS